MEIVTERLVLRDFVAEDWAAVLAYQRDPRYLRLYAWEDRTAAEAQAFVALFLEHQRQQPRSKFQLAVVLKESGALIGNCGVRLEAPGAPVADMGYELAPDHWGRGYATEAARAMVAFGFERLGLHRIEAWCMAENSASAGILRKLGMQQEGRLRDKEHFKGRWWDTLLFAILEDEWRAAAHPAR